MASFQVGNPSNTSLPGDMALKTQISQIATDNKLRATKNKLILGLRKYKQRTLRVDQRFFWKSKLTQ